MMTGLWSSRIPLAVAEIREYLTLHGPPPYLVQLGGRLLESPSWSSDPSDPLHPSPFRLRYTVRPAGQATADPIATVLAVDPHVRVTRLCVFGCRYALTDCSLPWRGLGRTQSYPHGYDVQISGPFNAVRVMHGLARLQWRHPRTLVLPRLSAQCMFDSSQIRRGTMSLICCGPQQPSPRKSPSRSCCSDVLALRTPIPS